MRYAILKVPNRSLRKSMQRALRSRAKRSERSEAAQNAAQGAVTSQFELDKYKTKRKTRKAILNLCFMPRAKGDRSQIRFKPGNAIGD